MLKWCTMVYEMNMKMFCLCLSFHIEFIDISQPTHCFIISFKCFLYIQSQSFATVRWNTAFGHSKVGLGSYSLTCLDPDLLLHLERREIYWEGYTHSY